MLRPRISVLMCVYNGEQFLSESIESILEQTYEDFELIIVNDGSTDSTVEIIESYTDNRIRLINNKSNIGLTKSLNIGLESAKGEFIARQDADDMSDKTRFEEQIAYLIKNKDVVVLGTQAKIIDKQGNIVNQPLGWFRPITENEVKWFCMFDSPFIHSSVMMRRGIIWHTYKGYNSSYRTSQDYELWSRIVYDHKCENLKNELVSFRHHPKSISSNYSISSLEGMANIIDNAVIKGTGEIAPRNFSTKWVSMLEPSFSENRFDIDDFVDVIEEMYKRFIHHNNILNSNKDLEKQKNYFFLKSFFQFFRSEKMKSYKLFVRICRKNYMIVTIFFKFLLHRYVKKNR